MPIASIAQILLRLYAIKIFIGAFAGVGGIFAVTPLDSVNLLLGLLPNIFSTIAGVAVWMIAPFLSRILTKGSNGQFTLTGITREDLYGAILFGLGVYFFMDSFSNVFVWIHYFWINSSDFVEGFHMEAEASSYYDFGERLLTMIAGIALILKFRAFARRLDRKHELSQQSDG